MQNGTSKGHGVYIHLAGNKLYANWDDDVISENLIYPDIDWPEYSSIMEEIYDDIERLNFKQFIQEIENPNLKQNIENLEVDIMRCQGVYTTVGGFKYCGGLKNFLFEGKGLFTSKVEINYYGDWKAVLGMELEYVFSIAGLFILESGIMIKWKEMVEWNMEKVPIIVGN